MSHCLAHFAELPTLPKKNQQIGQDRDTFSSSAKWVSARCPIFIWLKVTWVKKLVVWLVFLSSVSRVLVTGTGRFGKDVSAKKIRDVSAYFFCRNVRRHVFAETSAAMFLPKRPPPCFCRNVFCRNVFCRNVLFPSRICPHFL